MLAIATMLLVLLLCHEAQSSPHAILHIGPHKTASSHVQLALASLTKELESVNYYWPTRSNGSPMGMKDTANYAWVIKGLYNDTQKDVPNMSNFIQHSLNISRNIIISSEEFDDCNLDQVKTLKEHLQGFNVTVVFVYREFLSQLISLHFELNRFEHGPKVSMSFSGFLMSVMDHLPIYLRPLDILKSYADVFGAQNIRIIDLLGSTAAGEDITHALLCGVGNVLCGHNRLKPSGSRTNTAYSLLPAQMFSFYKSYVERQNNGTCTFCAPAFKEYPQFALRFAENSKVHAPPAITITKLTLLVPFAQQVDANLRATYGSVILHGNQTANFEAMSKAQVQEIQTELFLTNVYWNQWIHSEYEAALSSKKLCGC